MCAEVRVGWYDADDFIVEWLEWWTAAKNDKVIAWTRGSG
jgi:hypothetical protein